MLPLHLHEADACGDCKGPAIPDKVHVFHGLPQPLRKNGGLIEIAVFQQDGEFIAAEAREQILVADMPLKCQSHFAQQLVAHRMAQGVVDDLELVEIHIH